MTPEQIIKLVRTIDRTLPLDVDTVCFTVDQLMAFSNLILQEQSKSKVAVDTES